MANQDFPSGLMAVKNRNGSASEISILDCVTTVLYEGALAFISSTGLVGMCSATTITSTLARDIIGVFAQGKAAGAVSCEGSISKVMVYTDPEQLYVIQSDDDTTASLTSTIGKVFPVVAATANTGNATFLRSNCELDGSHGAAAACLVTTNAEILHCIKIHKVIGDTAAGSWRKLVVKLAPKAHIHRNNLGV